MSYLFSIRLGLLPLQWRRRLTLLALVANCWFIQPSQAFTVTKNVNTGIAPGEKLVLFDKAQKDHPPTVTDSGAAQSALGADGALETAITGNDRLTIKLKWQPHGDLKESFDATLYSAVMVTCRLEGGTTRLVPGGKAQEIRRADNLYFSAALFDAKGELVGFANLADVAEDGKTPVETVTLLIPMILFTKGTLADPHHVESVGFVWDKTRPEINRKFRLVVDKISLVE